MTAPVDGGRACTDMQEGRSIDLPRDGVPRISPEGIGLLTKGLAGDFSGWDRVPYLNHPNVLPDRCLSNAVIRADDRGHFTASVWFGSVYPTVKGMQVVPVVVFDRMDLKEGYSPPSPTIELRGADHWNRTVLLKGDGLSFACGAAGRCDPEESEDCPCKPESRIGRAVEAQKPVVRTLEEWA